MQFTYELVVQGTAVLRDSSPSGLAYVGTDGLAVCLGVHVRVRTPDRGDFRFVAHFDSDAEPATSKDALNAKIADWVQNWMTKMLGAFDAKVHLEVATFSGGGTFSTRAMHAGICNWSGQKLQMVGSDNFWAPYGEGGPSVIPPRNWGASLGKHGHWPCTVPKNP
jgi:hypothetical protein